MHRGERFALDAAVVQEIVWLPELAPVADASPAVVGAFSLRGRVLPVLDPSLCFGRAQSVLRVDDAVIVLEVGSERFGLIADEELDAVAIGPADIEQVGGDHALLAHATALLQGVAKRGEMLAMVLDAHALLAAALAGSAPIAAAQRSAVVMSEAQAEVLRGRARAMAQPLQADGPGGSPSYALVELDGELFGIPIEFVRELLPLRNVCPLPCCPAHILGSMNVRGQVLTLVDLRPIIGLPARQPLAEVVVVRAGELVFGVAVGEIADITGANAPALLPSFADRGLPFYRGTGRVDKRVFSVIDIETMLATRALHVKDGGADKSGSGHPGPYAGSA